MNDARSAASHPATPQHALLNFFTTHVATLHVYRMFDPDVETSGVELPWLPSPKKTIQSLILTDSATHGLRCSQFHPWSILCHLARFQA